MKTYTVEEINNILEGELIGSTDKKIEGPEQLEKAKENHITFIGNSKYAKLWADAKACVAIVDKKVKVESQEGKAIIIVNNAD